MRWPSHDQSSYDRIGGCICGDVTHLEVQRGFAHQLCRHSFAYAGWTSQAEGFSQRVWWVRRTRAGVRGAKSLAAKITVLWRLANIQLVPIDATLLIVSDYEVSDA